MQAVEVPGLALQDGPIELLRPADLAFLVQRQGLLERLPGLRRQRRGGRLSGWPSKGNPTNFADHRTSVPQSGIPRSRAAIAAGPAGIADVDVRGWQSRPV